MIDIHSSPMTRDLSRAEIMQIGAILWECYSRDDRYRKGMKEAILNAAASLPAWTSNRAVYDIFQSIVESFYIEPGIEMPWGKRIVP